MYRFGLFESFIFDRIRILIFQNTKTIQAKMNHKTKIWGICIFSKITKGTLPTNETMGDEMSATLYNFLIIQQI